MQEPLWLNQSLGEMETESGVFELLASANATYDKQTGTVVVALNSFLRLKRTKRPGARLFADSILGRRTVNEEAAQEKYAEAVGAIFANWVHCLEQTRPRRSAGTRNTESGTAAAIAFISLPARSFSGEPSGKYPDRIRTRLEAGRLPIGTKVVVECAPCKTLIESAVDPGRTHLAWFDAAGTHKCPNCGGKLTWQSFADTPSTDSHRCTHCGTGSAPLCAERGQPSED